jgi:hypothetical protein
MKEAIGYCMRSIIFLIVIGALISCATSEVWLNSPVKWIKVLGMTPLVLFLFGGIVFALVNMFYLLVMRGHGDWQ